MMTRDADKKREQMMMFSMDDMVPKDHMLRKIDRAIDWNFIYDLVEDKYCSDNGRPRMDPVMLIKIPFIQYLYGIKSMRQTIKEIEVNVAYRWFLGLDMLDPVPHVSTFGKNYTRRFKDTDLFEQIFSHILEQCMKFHLVDTSTVFVDSTHVKACANSKKMRKRIASQEALWYEEELKKEIMAKILDVRERKDKKSGLVFVFYKKIWEFVFCKKSGAGAKIQHQLCLQSEPCIPDAWLLLYINILLTFP